MHAAATGRVSKGGPEGPEGPEGSLPNMLGRRPDGAALGGHGPARPAHACTCIRRLLPHRDHGDDPCEAHCPAKVTSARALAFPVPNRFQPAFSLNHPVNKYNAAYRRAVDFLVTHIGIPRAEAIPYSNQITVLAELFRRLPNPTAEQYAAIEQWFWRTSVSGYFSGWNTGMMSSDHDAVRRFADGATREIEVEFVIPRPDIWRTRQFRLNAAHAKLLGCVLAHMKPVDLLTGQRIDVDKALAFANSKEFHHFFPKAFLKERGEPATRINVLSNIIVLTAASNKAISKSAPSEYLDKVAAFAGDALQEWLDSNLIPQKAFEAGLADNYREFLEIRSGAIHDLMMQKTGWEAPASMSNLRRS